MSQTPWIGSRVPRKEGRAKLTGSTRYIDDIRHPGMLYGATVRSSVPRGKIRQIHYGEGIPWNEFTIVTAKDIPGKNHVTLLLNDQPFLADRLINHQEEPVVLLAHPDRFLLEEARRKVTIEVDPLPPLFSLQDSF
jgi:CO/xanthine dehydrogenase Mo-binding subunit